MNPSSSETGFNAPAHELPAPMSAPEAATSTPEQAAAGTEKAPVAGRPSMAGMPAIPAPSPLMPAPVAPQGGAVKTTTNDVTSTASDSDLIEKEWVEKAKKIVERTRDDPYTQSNELTAVKADYLQKRYNKAVKLDM